MLKLVVITKRSLLSGDLVNWINVRDEIIDNDHIKRGLPSLSHWPVYGVWQGRGAAIFCSWRPDDGQNVGNGAAATTTTTTTMWSFTKGDRRRNQMKPLFSRLYLLYNHHFVDRLRLDSRFDIAKHLNSTDGWTGREWQMYSYFII